MVDRVQLSIEERDQVTAIRNALSAPSDQWVVARIALARSLQLAEAPDRSEYPVISAQTGGIELHSRQLTGEGREDEHSDFTDVYRALLSVYEGRDLFADEVAFHEALQRHVRRGLRVVAQEWKTLGDITQYIAQQLLFEAGAAGAPEDADPELPARMMRVLGELGVSATLAAVDNGPRLTRLTLELHAYEDLERLRRGLEKISFALGLGQDTLGFELAGGEQKVNLTIPRSPSSWRSVAWSDIRGELGTDEAKEMTLPICIGTDVLGVPFLFDLAGAPHLIVGGTTGSGKSMCLHALLLSILEGRSSKAELVLIDPKEVEFAAYERCDRVRGGVLRTAAEALSMLEELVTVMDERQEHFRGLGARDFTEAKCKDGTLERIVVVIDELGDLVMQERAIETPLIRLAQKARSSGIHLVLATQRPEAATFPGLLRSNIPSRIALTVQKSSESRIILDEVGAENLLMKGDMLIKLLGQTTVRAHGCRVDHADILAAVALA